MPEALPTTTLGSPFIELQSVDSTNNYARQQIHAHLAQHGMAFFAHQQLSGKGQMGKHWISEQGANIALSLVINPKSLALVQQFQLSACVAVSVHEFFAKYAGSGTRIKWPNDLCWQDRKAGGILIESVVRSRQSAVDSTQSAVRSPQSTVGSPQLTVPDQSVGSYGQPPIGKWEWAIIGIGININQTVFPSWLPNPVSLKQITGKIYDPVDLAKELCACVDKYLQLLLNEGSKNIFAAYNSVLYKLNEKVRLKKDNRVFEAIIKGVTPAGKLLVLRTIEEEFDFGEVEWMTKA